jgi:hypothetical protein
LNRPQCHNALDREVSAELDSAVKEISVDRGSCIVIIRGAGDTSCAPEPNRSQWGMPEINWDITPGSRCGEKPRSGTSSAV